MRGLGETQAKLQAQHNEVSRQLAEVNSKASDADAEYAKACENICAVQQTVGVCAPAPVSASV